MMRAQLAPLIATFVWKQKIAFVAYHAIIFSESHQFSNMRNKAQNAKMAIAKGILKHWNTILPKGKRK